MTFEPWSVVVVPFPFMDKRRAKRRPAVVLSPEAFQAAHRCSVLAMITDARNPSWPSDVTLTDLAAAGLRFPSVLRCKLFTLHSDLILARVGSLGRTDRILTRRTLQTALVR